MRVHYTAEVAWIRDGKGRLPLEIAFVEVRHPSRVYILQTKFRNDDVHTTRFSLRDLALNKSLRRNADRLDARFRLDERDLVSPRRVVETDEWSWRSDVKRMIGDETVTIGVRSEGQRRFFRDQCGFPNVVNVRPRLRDTPILGCRHRHGRLIPYACPAMEARTMAMELKCRK